MNGTDLDLLGGEVAGDHPTEQHPEILGAVVRNGGGEQLLIPEAELRAVDGMADDRRCKHCNEAFTPRTGAGGKPQKFCSEQCRRDYRPPKPNAAQCEPTPCAKPALPMVTAPKPAQENSTGFSWFDDSDCIVVPEQQAIAVYWNAAGNLVIRQERDWSRDEDDVVVIAAHNIQAFLDKLCDLCGIGGAP